jgi:hypothetical protein
MYRSCPHSCLITGFVAKVHNTTDATCGAGTACPLRTPKYITILLGYCVFCHSHYLVSDCLFDIFNFFSTFWNILRTNYCCPRTIGKNVFGHCVVRPSDDLYYPIGIFKLFQFVLCVLFKVF